MKYKVEITETLQRVVEVDANDQCEAEAIVEARWQKEEYVLNAEDFVGAEFKCMED